MCLMMYVCLLYLLSVAHRPIGLLRNKITLPYLTYKTNYEILLKSPSEMLSAHSETVPT